MRCSNGETRIPRIDANFPNGTMSELLYRDEVFKLVGFCMEIHRELGKGHDELIYKDAFVVELQRVNVPFNRELKYEVRYKGFILPHYYRADFVVWNKILFEAKAVEILTQAHVKQVLNYLAASKLELGLLVNFGADSLEWKRVILSRVKAQPSPIDFRL
jgi:GxxExxY protein